MWSRLFFLCLGKRQAAEAKKKNTTSSLSKPGHIDRYDTADYLRADSLCLLPLTYIPHTLSLSRMQTIAGISIHTAYIIPTYLGSGPSRQSSKSSGPMHRTFHYRNSIHARIRYYYGLYLTDLTYLTYLTDLLPLRNAPVLATATLSFSYSASAALHRIASRMIKVRPTVRPSIHPSVPSAILKPTYLYLRIFRYMYLPLLYFT